MLQQNNASQSSGNDSTNFSLTDEVWGNGGSLLFNGNLDELREVYQVLYDSQIPNENHAQTLEILSRIMKTSPRQLCNYLLIVITTQSPQQEMLDIRPLAALTLKNHIRSSWSVLGRTCVDWLRKELLPLLSHQHMLIRNAISSAIVTIVTHFTLQEWPQLLPSLIELLGTVPNMPNGGGSGEDVSGGVSNSALGAFTTLQKLCEDCGTQIDLDTTDAPLNYLMPHFIAFFKHPNEKIRLHALLCANHFIISRGSAMYDNMNEFLQNLFYLAMHDDCVDVQKHVCRALVLLLEVASDKLLPFLDDIIKYMLHKTNDSNNEVALEACEFWLAISEQQDAFDTLYVHLSALVPLLIRNMCYTQEEAIEQGGYIDSDEAIPDRDQDIAPRHHRARTHGGIFQLVDPEDEEEEDDDGTGGGSCDWNLRKCSAASLDLLSSVYRDSILDFILPIVEDMLNSDDWLMKEAAILVIGAIAEGCMTVMVRFLSTLFPRLLLALNDSRPLLRSITCWTLSRYAHWVVTDARDTFLQPLVDNLLERILDSHKRVQEAACSAFATLEEEACVELVPFLDKILQVLVLAFQKYQHKNLLILYDALGTLADSVGSHLNRPVHIERLLPPLIERWNALRNDDRDLFPLLECLSSVATALKDGFAPYCEPVYDRCVTLIEMTLERDFNSSQNNGGYMDKNYQLDKDFIIVSLDLLSGLAEGLETEIAHHVAKEDCKVLKLLGVCMQDALPEVRQSSFALLGDVTKSAFTHVEPFADHYIKIICANLHAEFVSVCNNAVWSIGEIAVKMDVKFRPYIESTVLFERLQIIMQRTPSTTKTLLENTAITIGRLGLIAPDLIAPHLATFIRPWCNSLRNIRDNDEKESAFRGIVVLVKANPDGAVASLVYLCDAIASWIDPKPDLKVAFDEVLQGYRQYLGDESWQLIFNQFPRALRERLKSSYNV